MVIQTWLNRYINYKTTGSLNKHGELKTYKLTVTQVNWADAFSDENFGNDQKGIKGKVKDQLSDIQRKLIAFIECELKKLPLSDAQGQILDIRDDTLSDAQRTALSYLIASEGDPGLLRSCIEQELETADDNYKLLLLRIRHRITKEIKYTSSEYGANSVLESYLETASQASSNTDSISSSSIDLPNAPQLTFKPKPIKINPEIASVTTKNYVEEGWFFDSEYTVWDGLKQFASYVKWTFFSFFSWSNQFVINNFHDNSKDYQVSNGKKQAVKNAFHVYNAQCEELKTMIDRVNGSDDEQLLTALLVELAQKYQAIQLKKTELNLAITKSKEEIWVEYFNSDLLEFYGELEIKIADHEIQIGAEIYTKIKDIINARPYLDWTALLKLLPENIQNYAEEKGANKGSTQKTTVVSNVDLKKAKQIEQLIAGDVYAPLPQDLSDFEIQGLVQRLEKIATNIPEKDSEIEREKRANALIILTKNNLLYNRLAFLVNDLEETKRADFLQAAEQAAKKIAKRPVTTDVDLHRQEQELSFERIIMLVSQINDANTGGFNTVIVELKEKVKNKFRKVPAFVESMKQKISSLRTDELPNIIQLAIELFIASRYAKENTSIEGLRKLYGDEQNGQSKKGWWDTFEFVYQQLEKALDKDNDQFNITAIMDKIDKFYENKQISFPKIEVYRSLKNALKLLKEDHPELRSYFQIVKDKIKELERQIVIVNGTMKNPLYDNDKKSDQNPNLLAIGNSKNYHSGNPIVEYRK